MDIRLAHLPSHMRADAAGALLQSERAAALWTTMLRFARTVFARIDRILAERRAREELLRLDDRELADIGLTRTDVLYGDLSKLNRRRSETDTAADA